jgi:hypothetical protein
MGPADGAASGPPPVAGGGEHSGSAAGAPPAGTSPALPIVGSLPCTIANLGKVLQPPAGGGAATPAGAAPGSGNLLSELLSPVNSLSPVLACDPTLAHLTQTIQSLSGPKPARRQAPAPATATTPAGQGLDDLLHLLQQLLSLAGGTH